MSNTTPTGAAAPTLPRKIIWECEGTHGWEAANLGEITAAVHKVVPGIYGLDVEFSVTWTDEYGFEHTRHIHTGGEYKTAKKARDAVAGCVGEAANKVR